MRLLLVFLLALAGACAAEIVPSPDAASENVERLPNGQYCVGCQLCTQSAWPPPFGTTTCVYNAACCNDQPSCRPPRDWSCGGELAPEPANDEQPENSSPLEGTELMPSSERGGCVGCQFCTISAWPPPFGSVVCEYSYWCCLQQQP